MAQYLTLPTIAEKLWPSYSNAFIPPDEVKRSGKRLQLIDVRTPDEWKSGHIPNAQHIFLGDLHKKMDQLDPTKKTAVYCGSGYRASIAASILKQAGFDSVSNVPGSWLAWKAARFPIACELQKESK